MDNPILARALSAVRANYTARITDGASHKDIIAPWILARAADVAAPGAHEKEGEAFLIDVFSSFENAVRYDLEVFENEDACALQRTINTFCEDRLHEYSDSAVPVYTHPKWLVFVELAAYEEDVSELVDSRNVTGEAVANAALYQIADRLFRALFDALSDACDEAENDLQDFVGV